MVEDQVIEGKTTEGQVKYVCSGADSIYLVMIFLSLYFFNAAMSKKKLDDGALFRQNLRTICIIYFMHIK